MQCHFALFVALLYPSWSMSSHQSAGHHKQLAAKIGHSKQPAAQQPAADNKGAFGFAAGTTGGGSLPPQTPKDIYELASWLADAVPRVILLDKTYDFTSGNATGPGCKPWNACNNGNLVQEARNYNHWCASEAQATNTPVQYQKAPLQPLTVGSNKSLLGYKDKGVIKGKGLLVWRVKNVIIRNIHITWLNPHLVWGGDAIDINGATNLWVDHCTFSFIGRQMIVTNLEKNQGITLSNNHFLGRTLWSARCENKHYWTVLLTGPDDHVTMANNCFDSTSGRSPKIGGSGKPNVVVHYYNNLHTNTLGESFEIAKGANMLAEGNAFVNMQIQDPGDAETNHGGNSYAPFTDQEAQACVASLGRACVTNVILKSAAIHFGKVLDVLNLFKTVDYIVHNSPKPAASIVNGVKGGCGVGHV